ncbi:hypothetical protein TNCV_3777221 [Trichonephila clavipes]|nr:hypothetical protein TNCV_3777221 [Trichonephila clavipes]
MRARIIGRALVESPEQESTIFEREKRNCKNNNKTNTISVGILVVCCTQPISELMKVREYYRHTNGVKENIRTPLCKVRFWPPGRILQGIAKP